MRLVLLCSIVLAAACVHRASAATDAGAPAKGAIAGTVQLTPAMPGPVRPGLPGSRPFGGALVVVADATGKEVARAIAGDDGKFSIEVPPGSYKVTAGPAARARYPRIASQDVTVTAGQTTTVDLFCDSGMR